MTTPRTPTPETPLRRFAREQREAQQRLAAELDADPQQRAMREALKLTKAESEDLARAEAQVTEAEEAVGRIIGAIQALEAGRTVTREFTTRDGRSLFRKLMDPPAKAKAAAELPALKEDLAAARGVLTSARRKRQSVLNAINTARMRRRQAAKAAHAPAPPPVKARGDWWSTDEAREKWSRGDAA